MREGSHADIPPGDWHMTQHLDRFGVKLECSHLCILTADVCLPQGHICSHHQRQSEDTEGSFRVHVAAMTSDLGSQCQ